MSTDTYVKKKVLANGKVKYQAQLWFQGVYYGAKTFDTEGMARKHKENELLRILRGELKPPGVRSAQRRIEEALDRPMTHWASLYVEEVGHGESRLAEYTLVGRLVAKKTLRDFSGKDGARLIKQLLIDWRHERQRRSKKPAVEGGPPPKPLSDQTLRLRFYALKRIIGFAKDKLPAQTPFEMPDMGDLFEFSPPPAHAAPRTRQPSDAEFALLLTELGAESELGQFLRVVYETGCRLGEARTATGANTLFNTVGQEVVGGHITLHAHKTSKKVGARDVPLSLFAAQLLHDRKLKHGQGLLFPTLRDTDRVCKMFDDACKAVGIADLLIKDFRRAFINRNKYCVAQVDLVKVVGPSSLLDAKSVSPSERAVQTAVGHTSIRMTGDYSHPELAHMSMVFTGTSRWPQISKLIESKQPAPAEAEAGQVTDVDVPALQQLLAETLAKLRSAGAVGSPVSRVAGAAPASTGPRALARSDASDAATTPSGAADTCPAETAVSRLWQRSERSAGQ